MMQIHQRSTVPPAPSPPPPPLAEGGGRDLHPFRTSTATAASSPSPGTRFVLPNMRGTRLIPFSLEDFLTRERHPPVGAEKEEGEATSAAANVSKEEKKGLEANGDDGWDDWGDEGEGGAFAEPEEEEKMTAVPAAEPAASTSKMTAPSKITAPSNMTTSSSMSPEKRLLFEASRYVPCRTTT